MKTYTITDDNRVRNSPFFVEGSDASFDFTHEYPLPLECDTFDRDGKPCRVRYIQGCDTIFKDEQVKRGWPEDRKPTEQERSLMTFVGSFLSVPQGYGKAEEYLEIVPWFDGKEGPRPYNSRILYKVHDQEKIDRDTLELETLITNARQLVLTGKRQELMGILRLAAPEISIDPNMDMKALRLQLLDIANQQPDFVLKSYRSAKEAIQVVISKAIDFRILNIDTAGQLQMMKNGRLTRVASISDAGGRAAKIDRVIGFMETEDGKSLLHEVKAAIKGYEQQHVTAEEEEEEAENEQLADQAEAVPKAGAKAIGAGEQVALPGSVGKGGKK